MPPRHPRKKPRDKISRARHVKFNIIRTSKRVESSAERPNKNVKEATNLSHFAENGKFFKVVRDGNKIISRENVFRGKRREKSDSKTRQIVASVISSRNMYTQATFVRSFIASHITYAYMCLLHVLHRLFILEKQKERNLYITKLVPLSH